MTAALVRKCNKCAKPFLKEYGCNKMKCSCGNIQCYVCSKDISGYSHFNDESPCPMYGDMADLLKKQVDTAEEETVQKLLKTRSDLKDEDIRVERRQKSSNEVTEIGETNWEDFTLPFTLPFPPSFEFPVEDPWQPMVLPGSTIVAQTDYNPVHEIRRTLSKQRGNNPFGNRGCEACSTCRRRKARVLSP